MIALTLKQPWTAAIFDGPKRVENRTWAPPAGTVVGGSHIALHAGKGWDDAGAAFLRERGIIAPDAALGSAIVGLVRVARVLARMDTPEGCEAVKLRRAVPAGAAELADPFFFGPIGWWLEDVVKLDRAVPCKGAQGLWRLPHEIEIDVLRQLPPRFDVDGLLEDERGAA